MSDKKEECSFESRLIKDKLSKLDKEARVIEGQSSSSKLFKSIKRLLLKTPIFVEVTISSSSMPFKDKESDNAFMAVDSKLPSKFNMSILICIDDFEWNLMTERNVDFNCWIRFSIFDLERFELTLLTDILISCLLKL